MASVDVPVALLGYGNVGSAVDRLLTEGADEIERATGHRLRVVRALVRDPERERDFPPAHGVLTTDFEAIRGDPTIAVVAEVTGGLEPTGTRVLELLRAGKPVVTANKQLVARRGAELSRRRRRPACSSASNQHVLDLAWVDVDPSSDDRVVHAALEEEVAVFVEPAEVADRERVSSSRRACLRLVPPVLELLRVWITYPNLADLIRSDAATALIQNEDLGIGVGLAHAARLLHPFTGRYAGGLSFRRAVELPHGSGGNSSITDRFVSSRIGAPA